MSDVESVAALLIEHGRDSIEGCRCGWADLGKSHAKHVAQVLDETGLLVTSEESDFIAYGIERGWLFLDNGGSCDVETRTHGVNCSCWVLQFDRVVRHVTAWKPVEP